MQATITHSRPFAGFFNAMSGGFAAIGNFLVMLSENNGRIQRVDQLNKMSDAQLAELGIARDRIVHHVFRDMFHV